MRDELEQQIRTLAQERFSRSGGPGGQNVNKVSTQVTVHVPVEELDLSDDERERLRDRLSNRISIEGDLVVHCSQTRSQSANREIAMNRVISLVDSAIRPKRVRRPTRPNRASVEKRLEQKRRQAEKKRRRRI